MKKPMLTPGGPPTVAAGPVLVQGVHPQLLQPQIQQLQQQQQQPQLEQLPKNIIQTRELLYRLIISQLFYDGYQQVHTLLSLPPLHARIFITVQVLEAWLKPRSKSTVPDLSLSLSQIFE